MVFPLSALVIFVISGVVNVYFCLLGLPLILVINYLLRRLRCPGCGVIVGAITLSFNGLRLYSPVSPNDCMHCGCDLTGERKPHNPANVDS